MPYNVSCGDLLLRDTQPAIGASISLKQHKLRLLYLVHRFRLKSDQEPALEEQEEFFPGINGEYIMGIQQMRQHRLKGFLPAIVTTAVQ